ncbi:MAG TPA: hypothetical protein VHD34_00260 [Xanthobacteraceae bacterium]|nr:hypothetical protein [Xanthobacteraceae bacterium]
MTSSAKAMARPVPPLPAWEDIPPGSADELAKARTELLNLAQWLARMANSYVGGMPQDRVVLRLDSRAPSFVTQPFEHDVALEIRLPDLEMQFLEAGKRVPHIFNPEEHSPAKVEAWLLVELLHRGIDRTKFSKQLPYNMSNLMTGDAEDHAPQECTAGLAQLAAWYRNAGAALGLMHDSGRLWVHPQTLHLSLAAKPGDASSAGFSPGNDEHPEPHFYRNGKKRVILSAAELARESNPAAAASRFLSENI